MWLLRRSGPEPCRSRPSAAWHRAGRVSLYSGLPPGTPPPAFDTNHVHYHELTVSGTSGASPAQTAQALGLIASGAVPVTDHITHHFPLAQFASVLTTVKSGQAIKVTIEP